MNHTIRKRRLDALCIREAEGTLTKQERTELKALFAEEEALKPSAKKNQHRQKRDLESSGNQVRALDRKEQALLAKIRTNSHLSDKKQKRYWQLRRKCEDETLTNAELKEYQLLNQEWETRNVKRVEALVALAEQRGMTLHCVMTELGLQGAQCDF